MKFIITVDTEADNQWKKNSNISLENVKFLTKFQNLCEKYDFIPTYLVTYEVANDKDSVHILKKWLEEGKCEIGAHLHPWTTPPFKNSHKNGFIEKSFPNELTDDELWRKLEVLTEKIKDSFEIQATSFRAGRWGFDKRMIKYLLELGYKVDCSVTPKIDWRSFKGKKDGIGGPDFRKASIYPSFLDQSSLLEIPMSVLYTGVLNKEKSSMSKLFLIMPNTLLKKILNKFLFKLKWCRIFPNTKLKDLKSLYKSALVNDLPVLEFMIHSSELMLGGSQCSKKEEDLENVYSNLEGFFEYLKDKDVQGIGVSDFLILYNEI
jgi:hypothetical protein